MAWDIISFTGGPIAIRGGTGSSSGDGACTIRLDGGGADADDAQDADVPDHGDVEDDDPGPATVDGLEIGKCWVRWNWNRNRIESELKGLLARPMYVLTDAQIAAAKRYDRGLWDDEKRRREPEIAKPKLTILVDQDIED